MSLEQFTYLHDLVKDFNNFSMKVRNKMTLFSLHVTRISKFFETRGMEWSGTALRVTSMIIKSNNMYK